MGGPCIRPLWDLVSADGLRPGKGALRPERHSNLIHPAWKNHAPPALREPEPLRGTAHDYPIAQRFAGYRVPPSSVYDPDPTDPVR